MSPWQNFAAAGLPQKAGIAMAENGDSGAFDQHALREALAPFGARFDSAQLFEEVVELLMESRRHAAVRRMLQVSRLGTKEIWGLFDEMERAAKAVAS